MNWILEMYGDAYSSMLLQNRRQESLPADRLPVASMPVVQAAGRLLGKR